MYTLVLLLSCTGLKSAGGLNPGHIFPAWSTAYCRSLCSSVLLRLSRVLSLFPCPSYVGGGEGDLSALPSSLRSGSSPVRIALSSSSLALTASACATSGGSWPSILSGNPLCPLPTAALCSGSCDCRSQRLVALLLLPLLAGGSSPFTRSTRNESLLAASIDNNGPSRCHIVNKQFKMGRGSFCRWLFPERKSIIG